MAFPKNYFFKNFSTSQNAALAIQPLVCLTEGADCSHTTLGSDEGLALPSQHRPPQNAQPKSQPWERASAVL